VSEVPPDAPIIPQEWVGGVKVVDIGDIRVARGLSRRPFSGCHHHALVYDDRERRVWCADCQKTLEPFDAFLSLVGQFDRARAIAEEKANEIAAAREHSLVRIAAKAMDDHWRKRRTIPTCPHCRNGLLPEDVSKMGRMSREIEIARRKRLEATHDQPHD